MEPYSAAGGLVRVYPSDRPGPGFVWVHGGAFFGGDIAMPEADSVARALARAGITVVSVDYRLAPVNAAISKAFDVAERAGVSYPGPSDDVLEAWRWTRDHARSLRLDPERIALGGASAGGNLAVGALLRLIAGGEPIPSALVLAYPTLLAEQPPAARELLDAIAAHPTARIGGPALMRDVYENFLGGTIADAPQAAIPGTAEEDALRRFPTTIIVASEADELRTCAQVLATRLIQQGRPVEYWVEAGTAHGHLNLPDDAAASRTLRRIADRLSAMRPNAGA